MSEEFATMTEAGAALGVSRTAIKKTIQSGKVFRDSVRRAQRAGSNASRCDASRPPEEAAMLYYKFKKLIIKCILFSAKWIVGRIVQLFREKDRGRGEGGSKIHLHPSFLCLKMCFQFKR